MVSWRRLKAGIAKSTILIVDDNADLVDMTKLNLESAGYRVMTSLTGKEGMKLAEKKRPDLIILDIMLPDVTGYGVSMYLREHDRTKHIPIIMLTGERTSDKDMHLGVKTGATYYMEKPYNTEQLLLRVQFALEAGKKGRVSDWKVRA